MGWKTPEELIGEELLVKYNLKGLKLRKETNIMDVWFDSGSSHRGVLEVWEGLHRPCDLYLEVQTNIEDGSILHF